MPRRSTLFVPGGCYHIYNRGANRNSLFYDESNYLYVLSLLKKYAQQFQISVIAYCLMPNHYHWLLRQDGASPAGLLPQRVFNIYSHALCNASRHSGALFAGRYHAIKVADEDYLLHLCRYIHANPVRHGIANAVHLWPYSNYLEWIDARPGTLVDRTFVRHHFPTPTAYKAYVHAYLTGRSSSPTDLTAYLHDLESS